MTLFHTFLLTDVTDNPNMVLKTENFNIEVAYVHVIIITMASFNLCIFINNRFVAAQNNDQRKKSNENLGKRKRTHFIQINSFLS